MNKINFHPDPEMMAAFSAGSIPLSQALCISTHLESCSACKDNLSRLNQLGSELVSHAKPASVSNALRERVMAKLGTQSPSTEQAPVKTDYTGNPEIPRCLRQFIPRDYTSLKWQRVAKGIFSSELCRDVNGAKVELIKMKAGGSVFNHSHLGEELTVVLEGSFSDAEGVYQEHDFILRNESHSHSPVATLDADCLCLAVTNAPIQFTGFFSRLLNPFLRRSYA